MSKPNKELIKQKISGLFGDGLKQKFSDHAGNISNKLNYFREEQINDYLDFVPSSVAVMEKPPSAQARLISKLIMIFVVVTVLWLCFSKVDIVVGAQGKIVPSGKVKVIQAASEGVVRDIYIRDGQLVKQGDPLIDLDSTTSEADEEQLLIKQTKALLTVQRVRAELGEQVVLGESIGDSAGLIATEQSLLEANNKAFAEKVSLLKHDRDQAQSVHKATSFEVETMNTKIEHLEQQLERKRRQAKRGLIARQEVDDIDFELRSSRKEKAVLTENITESRLKYESASEKLKAANVERRSELYKQLSEAEHQLKTAQQDLIKAEQRMLHQVLKAPVDGVIQQLAVHTIGAVVNRADKLMVLIPEEAELEVEAQILNKDIGFVTADQPANVKIDAFEYTRYGTLEGDLQWVGSDAIVDEKKGPVYPARIALKSNTLPNKVNDRVGTVVPGMSSSVDIVIGQRRLIEYFIGPLLRYKDESLNER